MVVVMTNDTETDLRPFLRIFRRVGKTAIVRVLDALAKAIDDLGAGLANGAKVSICPFEIVTLRARRIGSRVWENDVDVDDVRVGPMTIVQPDERNRQGAVGRT